MKVPKFLKRKRNIWIIVILIIIILIGFLIFGRKNNTGSIQTGFNEVPAKLSNAMFNYDVAQFRIWGGTRFNFFKRKKSSTFVH